MNRSPMRCVRTGRYKYILNLNPGEAYKTHISDGVAADGRDYFESWEKLAETDAGAAATVKRFRQRPAEELYDLERDPFEERNLYDDRRATAESLARRLDALVRQYSSTDPEGSSKPAHLPDHFAKQIASLGYVGSKRPPALMPSGRGPDPKDCIALFNARRDQDEAIGKAAPLHCQ